MGASDRDSILFFARHLPQDHLFFLRSDITQPAIVDEWVKGVENGATITLLAEPDGTLEGYASLQLSQVRWTRKIGEVAINIAPEWQSRGLGEALCAEIVSLGRILELRKVTAQMVAEHKSARAMFERLGFRMQAFLPDWVEDQDGRTRDLLLMAYDLRTAERKTSASGCASSEQFSRTIVDRAVEFGTHRFGCFGRSLARSRACIFGKRVHQAPARVDDYAASVGPCCGDCVVGSRALRAVAGHQDDAVRHQLASAARMVRVGGADHRANRCQIMRADKIAAPSMDALGNHLPEWPV
jgi:L-amino acid N-acyltransferase YncA